MSSDSEWAFPEIILTILNPELERPTQPLVRRQTIQGIHQRVVDDKQKKMSQSYERQFNLIELGKRWTLKLRHLAHHTVK